MKKKSAPTTETSNNYGTSNIAIGITGKRQLSAAELARIAPMVEQAIRNIVKVEGVVGKAAVIGISPLAEGADTLFAKTIMKMGYDLRCFLPFEEEEYAGDFTTDAARGEFRRLYANLPPSSKTILGSVSQTERNQLYLAAGKRVVEESHYLIAIWDEQSAKGLGGTGDIVKYAMQTIEAGNCQLKQVLVINPNDEIAKISVSHRIDSKTGIPDSALPFAFIRDIESHECLAEENKKRYRSAWNITSLLGLIAAVVFALKLSLPQRLGMKSYLSSAELTLILVIVLVIVFLKPPRAHGLHLFHRGIAERLRILETYYKARLPSPPLRDNPIFLALRQDLKHVSDKVYDLRECLTVIDLAYSPQYAVANSYEAVKKLVEGQIVYHSGRLTKKKLHRKHEMNEMASNAFVFLFVIVVALHAVEDNMEHPPSCLKWLHGEYFSPALLFVSLAIPAIVARIEAGKFFNEWKKLAVQSDAMKGYFNRQMDRLNSGEDPATVLDRVDQDMFNENMDWQILMMDKGHWPAGA